MTSFDQHRRSTFGLVRAMQRTAGTWRQRPGLLAVALLAGAIFTSGCDKDPPKKPNPPARTATPAEAIPPAPPPPPLVTPEPEPPPPPPPSVIVTPPAKTPVPTTASTRPRVAGRKAGDTLNVSWQGSCVASRIVAVPKPGVYRVAYDWFGQSFDQTIDESRICKE